MFDTTTLPDIAAEGISSNAAPLEWVGMEAIALPIRIPTSPDTGVEVAASADVLVDIDQPGTKGIHMSRLYLKLKDHLANQTLTLESVQTLLRALVQSQSGISTSALFRVRFDLPLLKPALLSAETGFQAYPVQLSATLKDGAVETTLDLTIPYSSTCPCSAALSRQLMAQRIDEVFAADTVNKADLMQWIRSEAGSVATPHSQRSYAFLKLTFAAGSFPDLAALIPAFEKVIGTPVQAAVKRIDEQAFAKLNAENLMFCEDTARKLKAALEAMPDVTDYWFKVEHQESLHAHNAVAIDRKSP